MMMMIMMMMMMVNMKKTMRMMVMPEKGISGKWKSIDDFLRHCQHPLLSNALSNIEEEEEKKFCQ